MLAMRNVPMDVARKVVDALPDLEYPTERWAWRYDLNKARIEVFGDILCTVELTMTDGSIYEWHIARPQRVLRFLASQSDALKRIIQGMPSSPEKPLTILHYHDEITPGHLLAPQHARMFTSFRFAFEEIGRYVVRVCCIENDSAQNGQRWDVGCNGKADACVLYLQLRRLSDDPYKRTIQFHEPWSGQSFMIHGPCGECTWTMES